MRVCRTGTFRMELVLNFPGSKPVLCIGEAAGTRPPGRNRTLHSDFFLQIHIVTASPPQLVV